MKVVTTGGLLVIKHPPSRIYYYSNVCVMKVKWVNCVAVHSVMFLSDSRNDCTIDFTKGKIRMLLREDTLHFFGEDNHTAKN